MELGHSGLIKYSSKIAFSDATAWNTGYDRAKVIQMLKEDASQTNASRPDIP